MSEDISLTISSAMSADAPVENGVSDALARASEALKEAATALDRGPQYHPTAGWMNGYRQSIRAMVSSIEFLAKEIAK